MNQRDLSSQVTNRNDLSLVKVQGRSHKHKHMVKFTVKVHGSCLVNFGTPYCKSTMSHIQLYWQIPEC